MSFNFWDLNNYIMYLVSAVPFLILSFFLYVYARITIHRLSKIKIISGLTGANTARMIFNQNNILDASVKAVNGNYNDKYVYSTHTIELSPSVFYNSTVATVSISAHESGHAIQHANGSNYSIITSFIGFVTQICLIFPLPMIIVGFVFKSYTFISLAAILFISLVIFSLLTIPIELDASRKGIKTLKKCDCLTKQEFKNIKKMLYISAFNYVSATFASFLFLLKVVDLFDEKDFKN